MKRRDLLRHLLAHGCRMEREGAKPSLWINPTTNEVEAVPRHVEVGKHLAGKICRQLSVPEPRGGRAIEAARPSPHGYQPRRPGLIPLGMQRGL